MTHVNFKDYFRKHYGETKTVSLLLNLGGLGLGEMYNDKIVFRIGQQLHGLGPAEELSIDVIDIIDDGGKSYNDKVQRLIPHYAKFVHHV